MKLQNIVKCHKNQFCYILSLCVLLQLAYNQMASAYAITSGHCQKNISVKYQVPMTKTRYTQNQNELIPATKSSSDIVGAVEQYVVYEERFRWDTIQVCCPGYRTIIFGFCEPICREQCPAHSYCIEPNKCICMRGYEASHHPNKKHQLICRPICQGGCPEHAVCVAHNECECRPGYKDVSNWFSSLRCERIQCGADQRYDLERRACVKIEMSMEELMQRVAERLAKGLDTTEREDVTYGDNEDSAQQ